MSGAIAADWIAVDWGTSNLRAWAMSEAGEVLAEGASAKGMSTLTPEGYAPALLELAEGWLADGRRTTALVCGMAGARQGWAEAPYAPVPCTPLDPARTVSPPCPDPRLDVRLLPGLSQDRPADVMRGEETQVAGIVARRPRFDGVVCLPGTHTKWVHASAQEVVSFRTFMTGELFSILVETSILRHGLSGGEGLDEAAFAAAVEETLSKPEAVAAQLFSLRAEHLLHGLAPETARARLSGLLIGMELGAARPWWLGREVIVVGAPALAARYAAALEALGAPSQVIDAGAATLDGLRAARAAMTGGGA